MRTPRSRRPPTLPTRSWRERRSVTALRRLASVLCCRTARSNRQFRELATHAANLDSVRLAGRHYPAVSLAGSLYRRCPPSTISVRSRATRRCHELSPRTEAPFQAARTDQFTNLASQTVCRLRVDRRDRIATIQSPRGAPWLATIVPTSSERSRLVCMYSPPPCQLASRLILSQARERRLGAPCAR
jgi:hypothetical protein